jgi:hypothetical protein
MATPQIQAIDDLIAESNIVTQVSAKSGNSYDMLQIKLINGLDIELFIDRPYMAILKMLLKENNK